MPATIVVGVEGWQELQKTIEQLSAAVAGEALQAAAEAGAAPMLSVMQQKVPVKSGKTKRGLGVQVVAHDREHATVAIGSFRSRIAPLLEYGHQLVRGGKLGKGGRVVGHVAAHPFVRPAFDEQGEAAVRAVGDALWKDLEGVGAKE